ncbi:MAG: DUF4252 domain-containing protein [Acidobacteriota bacterium]|nr:MAG: DUF4252 domain-containing protein [Acidobacteriota bacterium]
MKTTIYQVRTGIGIALTLALGTLAPGFADEPPAQPSQGLVDGSMLLQFADDDGELIKIAVSKPMLKIVAEALKGQDSSVARAFTGLESVKAIVMDVRRERLDAARKTVAQLAGELEAEGWQAIAQVRNKQTHLNVLTLPRGEKLYGLTVVIANGDEGQVIFANIAGLIDPGDLQTIISRLQLPGAEFVPKPEAESPDEQ